MAVPSGGAAGGGDTEAEAGQAAGCPRHLEVALGARSCGRWWVTVPVPGWRWGWMGSGGRGTLTRAGDGEDAVGDAEDHAEGVDGFAGVGALVGFFHVPDGQRALPGLAHDRHPARHAWHPAPGTQCPAHAAPGMLGTQHRQRNTAPLPAQAPPLIAHPAPSCKPRPRGEAPPTVQLPCPPRAWPLLAVSSAPLLGVLPRTPRPPQQATPPVQAPPPSASPSRHRALP